MLKLDNDVNVHRIKRKQEFVLGDSVNVRHQCGLKEHFICNISMLAYVYVII